MTGIKHDDDCEAEFIYGLMAWSPCGCLDRAVPSGRHVNVDIDTTHLEGRALAMANALNAYGMYVVDR